MASKRLTRSMGPSGGGATALCDNLGTELLDVIFHKLGPSPMHLAALPSVCKAWRDIVQQETLRRLCLEAAPALCERMGYGASNQPPGGWLGFFKFLRYCPGLCRSSIRPEEIGDELLGPAGPHTGKSVWLSNWACRGRGPTAEGEVP